MLFTCVGNLFTEFHFIFACMPHLADLLSHEVMWSCIGVCRWQWPKQTLLSLAAFCRCSKKDPATFREAKSRLQTSNHVGVSANVIWIIERYCTTFGFSLVLIFDDIGSFLWNIGVYPLTCLSFLVGFWSQLHENPSIHLRTMQNHDYWCSTFGDPQVGGDHVGKLFMLATIKLMDKIQITSWNL